MFNLDKIIERGTEKLRKAAKEAEERRTETLPFLKESALPVLEAAAAKLNQAGHKATTAIAPLSAGDDPAAFLRISLVTDAGELPGSYLALSRSEHKVTAHGIIAQRDDDYETKQGTDEYSGTEWLEQTVEEFIEHVFAGATKRLKDEEPFVFV